MKQILAGIQNLKQLISAAPITIRFGLLVFVFGAALDLLFHAAPASLSSVLMIYLGYEGQNAHLVTLLGMVLILLGILFNKPRRTEPVRNHQHPGERHPGEHRPGDPH